MFQIIDKQTFKPVKSRFISAAKAYKWAKKNLPADSCGPWGANNWYTKYFIQKY